MIRLKNRGDTIVEVLIAMVVVSAVLGGAFVSANRSATANRRAQERGEATKFAEEQLERLKSLVASADTDLAFNDTVYCVNSDASSVTELPGSPQSLPAPEADNLTNYPAECSVGTNGRYKVSVDRDSAVNTNQFTVRTTWDRLGGGRDYIEFVTRLYQP